MLRVFVGLLAAVLLLAPGASAQTLLTSAPDATSQGPGQLDLFVQGENEELLQNHHDYRTGSWSGWHRPSTGHFGDESMTSAPGAASFASDVFPSGGFDVVARGPDHVVYHSRSRPGEEHPLYRLEGRITYGPDAAAVPTEGILHVVACSESNVLQYRSYRNMPSVPWGSFWKLIGGTCTADPTIVHTAYGPYTRIDAFSRGLDGAVSHWRGTWDPTRPHEVFWNSPSRIDGVVTSGVDAASSDSGRIDLFARGQNNELLYNRYLAAGSGGSWSGWQNLGGDVTSDPTAISAERGRIDVFARCAEDALHHWSFWQGVWRLTNIGDCSTEVYEPEGPDEILDDDYEDPEVDPDSPSPAASASQPLTLSTERETRALALLELDGRVRGLLGSTKYTVEKIGPWTEPRDDGTQREVGATMILALSERRDWPMTEWPRIGYLPESDTYLESTNTFAIAGVTKILVDIDLTKARVVGISPLGGIVTKRPPGERSMKPSPWRGY